MSQQCCARIQIATSRSLELDPEFAGSMFYCVRDPLHEGPHWIIMPSKSESPAPPPCEACESHDRKCKSQCSIDRMTHHAEIAELRALFGPLMDEADWHVEGCDCAGCVWFARARAVLAPKEGT
jgi:hypothetical protein